MQRFTQYSAFTLSLFLAGLYTSGAALAQTSQVAQADDVRIEEITVTAQKRAESLQDVPISIAAIAGARIEEFGFNEFRDIDRLIPNLKISASAASDSISIRGIGSGAGNLTFEQSVGLFVDGIYAGRSHQYQNPFLDVERIEVLRGPQGGLAGKNTAAGAINIISKRPTDQLERSVTAAYEFELGGEELQAMISGPISDRVKGRFVAKYQNQEGWMTNPLFPGKEEPFRKAYAMRATGMIDASDDVTITGKLEWSQVRETGCIYETTNVRRAKLTHVQGCNGFNRTRERDADFTQSPNATITIDWDIAGHTLTSISGYSHYYTKKLTDGDFSELDLVVARFFEDFDQYSEEVRLVSPTGQMIEYVVGAYIHDYNLYTNRQNSFNVNAANSGSTIRQHDQDDKLVSTFASGTVNFSEAFRSTASLRYTHEKKTGFITRDNIPVVPATNLTTDFGATRKENQWDPALNVQWNANDGTMLYASYTHGSKGGGFTGDTTNVTPATYQYEDEGASGLEAGVKYTGDRVLLALTAYRTNFKDLQVTIRDPQAPGGLFETRNVGRSRSSGFEFESSFKPTQELFLTLSAAYLNAKYTFYPNARCLFPNEAVAGCLQNLSGTKFDAAPEWTGAASANYRGELTNTLSLIVGLQGAYQSTVNKLSNPICLSKSYVKLDARVGIEADSGWSAILRSRNLTDKKTFSGCPGTPLRAGFFTYNTEPPRTVAFEVNYTF